VETGRLIHADVASKRWLYTTLIAGLTWSACLSLAGHAGAEEGACGLETGIWATPKNACRYARWPNVAAALFGNDALLEWQRGYYRYQGGTCGIRSAQRETQRCKLELECSVGGTQSMGWATIEPRTSLEFRFGTGPDSHIYYRCDIPAAPR
jgi:hypothetical protein